MEAQVIAAKGADQCADAVGISDVEGRMLHQRQHRRHGFGQGRSRLQAHPLVQHQRVVPEAVVEVVEGGVAEGRLHAGQRGKAGDHVGHVVGAAIVRIGQAGRGLVIACSEIAQAGIAQGAATGGNGVGAEIAFVAHVFV